VTSIYERFRDLLRSEVPVALATLIEGPDVGAKLLVEESGSTLGGLGSKQLDRVVGRDAIAMLDAGTSEVRHYGPQGEARQHDLSVSDYLNKLEAISVLETRCAFSLMTRSLTCRRSLEPCRLVSDTWGQWVLAKLMRNGLSD